LWQDPAHLHDCAVRALQYTENKQSWQSYANKHVEIYEALRSTPSAQLTQSFDAHHRASWRVAHVVTRLDLGGAQVMTLAEAEAAACARTVAGSYLVRGGAGALEKEALKNCDIQHVYVRALQRQLNTSDDALALLQLGASLLLLRRM